MTSDAAQGRPVPDTDDLRLLAEIINNGAIGLPEAAWNARMSQAEAAARFVDMAERGMPLRLVAEGDRQMLWRIAQAGPATSGLDLPPAPVPAPTPPSATPGEAGQMAAAAGLPVGLPPASAVPPHEQAMAGAVPLGQPPFGIPPAADADQPEDESAPQPSAAVPQPEAPPEPTPDEPEPEAAQPSSPRDPTHRVMISGQPTQSIVGASGEHLDVSLQQIIDPADQILISVGYRVGEGERALLVQTSVGNPGPVDYESLPDLSLVLLDSAGRVLPKAAMAVGGYPAHRVGVPANTLVSGWTVFLVPATTEVAELRWSARPDLAAPSVSWGFGPA